MVSGNMFTVHPGSIAMHSAWNRLAVKNLNGRLIVLCVYVLSG